jgi:hypothetical protein
VRAWVDAAVKCAGAPRLADEAADALRLAAVLLDSPLPQALADQYLEPA